ncbi:MAG: hypothetical protein M3Q49_07665 [Actinomycetota bacterium]|nr:hypothetical protein [Actinomycetota bacterium]
MRPEELSEQLRRGTGPFLARRRKVASLALAAAGSMGLISLYQLGVMAAFDALQAGKLTVDQWTQHRTFCFWCLLAAGATFATVPLVMPEARAAFRHLSRGSS